MKIKKNDVKKSHNLITARMDLSAREQDLATLVMLDVKKSADSLKITSDGIFDHTIQIDKDKLQTTFEFKAHELAKLFGVSVKALSNPIPLSKSQKELILKGDIDKSTIPRMSLLEVTCEKLQSRKIYVRGENGEFFIHTLIPSASFSNGLLSLGITQQMALLMLNYGPQGNNFGIIDAKLFFKLKSANAKRVLDLISRFKNSADYSCSLSDLCEMTGSNYSDFKDFSTLRKSLLDNAIKAIIKGSEGVWEAKDDDKRGYIIKKTAPRNGFSPEDKVIFQMKYNKPDIKDKVNTDDLSLDKLTDYINSYLVDEKGFMVTKKMLDKYLNLTSDLDLVESYKLDQTYLFSLYGQAVFKMNIN